MVNAAHTPFLSARHRLIFQAPIWSNTLVFKHDFLFLHLFIHPFIHHFPSTFIYHLCFLVYQISSLFPPSLLLVQIKLCCQLQKWNEPLFIFLVLHKHKHVLICVAALTDFPVRTSWYRLPPSAGLKAVREWGGFLCVGVDVIKLLLKPFQLCGVNT